MFNFNLLKGFGWMGGLTVLTKSIALIKIGILARLLSPEQFGTYGIALIVLGLLEMLTETGINIFLIQQKEEVKSFLNSAWVVSIFRGILICFFIIIFSGQISIFFNQPKSQILLTFISFVALVRGFINPMKVNFQKELKFKKVFLFQAGLYLIDAVVAITFGIIFKSEIAFVAGMLIAAVCEVIISFIIFSDRPKFIFEKPKFIKIINSGKWVTGAGIFSYIFQNIDNAVIGKVLGSANLGFYQQAYSIATLPVSGVSDIFNRVMFPTFVKITQDKLRLKKVFIKVFLNFFVISLVFGIIGLLFTDQIITIFLGVKWLSISGVLKVLLILGIFKAILNTSYSLFLALGLQKVVMLSELVGILAMAIAVYPLVIKFGNLGGAYSAIIAVISSLPVVLLNLKKVFK